ncbi:hypothetical protein [Aliiroseovarius crassostreae]|uniref:hypothetical protein n=1 Tax=Aliiroseovarius crassostreae TaxID=154981 RepID=UPI0021FF53CB|nr:hypothetical protein [Aliiroseovarius crassostreae]UWQ05140.1 hypothetical protein K3X22_01305 [Aliiroseovarius crassostreae]
MTEREKILEAALEQFIRPVKGIPFEVVVRALCGVSVLRFDRQDSDCCEVLEKIQQAMRWAGLEANKRPIQRPRPNEVGNDMEPFVVEGLRQVGLEAAPPKTKSGKGKSTGYPDVLIITDGIPVYLEVKTYAAENHDTTQRSFYMSPAEDSKVSVDAYHLVVGFEILDRGVNGLRDARNRELRNYCPTAFTLVDLYGMSCDMKSEFNSDNRRMYEDHRVLLRESII